MVIHPRPKSTSAASLTSGHIELIKYLWEYHTASLAELAPSFFQTTKGIFAGGVKMPDL